MGINLKQAAAYIHGQAPAKLDGLFHAVEAKCKELALVPGSRDNVAGGDGTAISGNVRGILTFIDSVQPITDEDKTEVKADDADVSKPGDSHETLVAKASVRAGKETAEKERKARLAAKEADHTALRKLYGTLKAKFASSGYKPKPVTPALT